MEIKRCVNCKKKNRELRDLGLQVKGLEMIEKRLVKEKKELERENKRLREMTPFGAPD